MKWEKNCHDLWFCWDWKLKSKFEGDIESDLWAIVDESQYYFIGLSPIICDNDGVEDVVWSLFLNCCRCLGEDQPAVEGDGQQEVVLGGENEGNDNEDGGIESYHNVNGDVKEEVDVESESQSPNNGDGDTGEEVVVEVGIEAHDNVNGMANEKAFVHGEEDLADNVNDEAYEDHVVECEIEAKHVFGDGEGEVGGEDPVVECEVEVEHIVRDGEEELGGKIDNEEDDEYEVSSWTKSEGDVMSGDELYDVRIERDDMEDELYDPSQPVQPTETQPSQPVQPTQTQASQPLQPTQTQPSQITGRAPILLSQPQQGNMITQGTQIPLPSQPTQISSFNVVDPPTRPNYREKLSYRKGPISKQQGPNFNHFAAVFCFFKLNV
ncbi:hypothetical protein DEO72_LG6g539 [Vigna unguiculata]|uniref:Uncharacterized protein n=1 Tax=Vigna unguiculata TaxID=3917 RepID=A0A4D6M3M1_VIGUN|nr:hypothetical protein DEO72_LG6g539 [Vigna unguiculata]